MHHLNTQVGLCWRRCCCRARWRCSGGWRAALTLEETETCMLVSKQGWAHAQMLLSGPAVTGGDACGQRVLPHPVKDKET